MRTRNQFNADQYRWVSTDNDVMARLTNDVVELVTKTYSKTSRLYKVASKLLKTQQEFNALLAEEGGVINGGGDTAGVSGEVAGL